MFRVRGLTYRYPRAARPAVDGLTLDLPGGQTVAVLGPSGCGKSTLLGLLGLLREDRPEAGEVEYYDGRSAVRYADLYPHRDRMTAVRQAGFGFVLQTCYLLPHFSGRDNVGMPLAARGLPPAAARARADVLIAAADDLIGGSFLTAAAAGPPREMSLGQRQRLAVLRAIAAGPRVLFADEPTSNLDPGNARAVFTLMARWRRGELPSGDPPDPGRTLLLVCHSVDAALNEAAADRLVVIQDGRLVEDFPRADWPAKERRVRSILDPRPGGGEP